MHERLPGLALMWRLLLSGLALLAGAVAVRAQLAPRDAVENFRLPKYDEDGYLKWLLAGSRGIFIGDEEVDVVRMVLRIFAPGVPPREKTRIEAAQATLFIDQDRAVGSDSIQIDSDEFFLTGRNWLWEGATDTIIVEDAVSVRFYGELIDVLE